MKKYFKGLMIFVIALVITVVPVPTTVFAASAPEWVDKTTFGTNEHLFFANGTPIIIDDDQYGAKITWDGGSKVITVDTIIFGGGYGSTADQISTSITMNGGSVDTLFGGSLGTSTIITTSVIVNDGKVDWVHGGGASNLVSAHNGTSTVNESSVIIRGGTTITNGYGVIYGGGQGLSQTGMAYVEISGGGNWGYVTGGGSNGNTEASTVVVTDGTIGLIQGVNRGTVGEAGILVLGGTIDSVYAGGETEDSSVTGTLEQIKVGLLGGTVTNLRIGKNGGIQMTSANGVKVYYRTGVITNNLETSAFASQEEGVLVIIDEELLLLLPKGVKLSELTGDDLTALNAKKEKDGFIFVKFKNSIDEKDFAENTTINTDLLLDTVFEAITITSGANSMWTKESSTGLTIKSNGLFANFTGIKVNGVELSSEHYTVVEGSTIITLNPSYLNTLEPGTYNIQLYFNQLADPTTSFTIQATNSNVTNPNTSDINAQFMIFSILIASLGLTFVAIKFKKKNQN